MPADYAIDDDALVRRCRIERCRAGGPGGQHLNRTESAIRIVHLDSGVEARCQDHRERGANQRAALAQLRLRLALRLRGRADPAWLGPFRRGSRLNLGSGSPSYYLVVAVLLDALAAARGSLAEAGDALGLSTSQVVRVLGEDKEVRVAANELRAGYGLGSLQ